jgi:hypothetical protein
LFISLIHLFTFYHLTYILSQLSQVRISSFFLPIFPSHISQHLFSHFFQIQFFKLSCISSYLFPHISSYLFPHISPYLFPRISSYLFLVFPLIYFLVFPPIYFLLFPRIYFPVGNPSYEFAARRGLNFIWQRRSQLDLVGSLIDVNSGKYVVLGEIHNAHDIDDC